MAAALLLANLAAAASSQTPLDKYLAGMRTLRSEFSQTVTDGRGEQLQQANGKLVIVRPGRFRWELTPAGNPSAAVDDRRREKPVVLRSATSSRSRSSPRRC